ncbi:hypothetical protein SVAN01_03760 [Stagonosporopsis vannaccii]|nr:hypothetical protein SVAN01_03760 [Stagonosporopsis vannaccii]
MTVVPDYASYWNLGVIMQQIQCLNLNFQDRKTVCMSFCMLEKSRKAVHARDDVDEDEEEVDETVDDGRGGRFA